MGVYRRTTCAFIARPAYSRAKTTFDIGQSRGKTGIDEARLDVVGWFGVLVPAATPRAIVEKLSADINRTLAREDIAGPLRDSGIEPAGTSPEQYARILRADTAKWRQMIDEAGIKAD